MVRPPQILVQLGLIREGVFWKLQKVLYGLRSGPKKWGDHRDEVLKRMKVSVEKGNRTQTARCEACENCANIWKIIEEDKIVGYFLVYVDDVLIVGPQEWVKATIAAFKEQWECKVSGIIF